MSEHTVRWTITGELYKCIIMFSLKELIYLLSHTFYHLIHPPPILINFESIFWEYLDCGLTHTQRHQPKIPVGIVKDTLVTFIYLQEPLKKHIRIQDSWICETEVSGAPLKTLVFLPLLAVSGVWRKNKLDIWRGAAGKLTKNAGKSWIEPAAADWHKSEKYKIQCWRLNCLDDSWLVKEWPDAWGRLSKLIKYQMHQIESHTAKLD